MSVDDVSVSERRKIMNAVSRSTTRRRVTSVAILAMGFALTVVVKIARNRIETGVPMWAMDVLPNFICGAVLPIAPMAGDRSIRWIDFLFFCGLVVLGLFAYELMQFALPNRTFSSNDLVASAVGVLLPVLLSRCFFDASEQRTISAEQTYEPELAADQKSNEA